MPRFQCETSGKWLQVQNVAAGQNFTCPACGTTHVLPADTAAPIANPFESAPPPSAPAEPKLDLAPAQDSKPPPPPGVHSKYAVSHGICVFHPQVQASGKCRRCRKALCETCAFRAGALVFCADCASRPDPERAEAAAKKGMWSLICSVLSVLVLVGAVVVVLTVQDPQTATIVDGCFTWISLGLAIAGLVMGLTSRDGGRRPVTGLIGAIISGLFLGLLVLLMIVGAAAGG